MLRTLPPPDPRALERLRRAAGALGARWPAGMEYGEFIRSLDANVPAHAALLHEATSVMRGAAYVGFDGVVPEYARHGALAEEYAHVTAPLRRLVDRYATECALAAHAGTPVPGWVRQRLAALPAAMSAADHRASALERAAVDLAEATVLAPRVGEVFDATAIDDGLVQLADPAVRAKCDGAPPVGQVVRVRLEVADPASRTVRFVAV